MDWPAHFDQCLFLCSQREFIAGTSKDQIARRSMAQVTIQLFEQVTNPRLNSVTAGLGTRPSRIDICRPGGLPLPERVDARSYGFRRLKICISPRIQPEQIKGARRNKGILSGIEYGAGPIQQRGRQCFERESDGVACFNHHAARVRLRNTSSRSASRVDTSTMPSPARWTASITSPALALSLR